MDIYLVFLILGGIGLAAMGLLGLGSHGHAGGLRGHVGHGQAGLHGHAASHGHSATSAHATGHQQSSQSGISPLWQLMSPRIIFAICLGLGATGLALRPILGGPFLPIAAVIGGLALERLVVLPLWNLGMRFGSNPALTLESALDADATVVSSFDAQGHGMVSIEIDGQLVQLLATLRPIEIGSGERIRTGDKVRIEEIDAERNRCTVSRL